MGGAAERAAGGAGAVAGPGGGVPRQDAAGGTHLPPHPARAPPLAPPPPALREQLYVLPQPRPGRPRPAKHHHLSTSMSVLFRISVDGKGLKASEWFRRMMSHE